MKLSLNCHVIGNDDVDDRGEGLLWLQLRQQLC
jgi:hypothetical protein